jgi:hypothetical protein
MSSVPSHVLQFITRLALLPLLSVACGANDGDQASSSSRSSLAVRIAEVGRRGGPEREERLSRDISGAGEREKCPFSSCSERPSVHLLAGALGGPGWADGTGHEARLRAPADVTWDASGYAYVVDGPAIRRIDPKTSIVTTLQLRSSETGEPFEFVAPTSIASDDAGQLFVVEWSELFRIVIETGEVSAVTSSDAGTEDGIGSDAPLMFPRAVASYAGNLYVIDGTRTIRRIEAGSNIITTFVGDRWSQGSTDGVGDQAHFIAPSNITSDGRGHLFVLDTGQIREIEVETATVTTVYGGDPDAIPDFYDFLQTNDLVSDGNGILYLSEYARVRRLDLATGALTVVAGERAEYGSRDGIGTAARFEHLGGLALDDQDDLLVGDQRTATIRRINVATNAVTTLAGLPASSGSVDGRGPQVRFSFPLGLTTGDRGDAYVIDAVDPQRIRKIELADSRVTTLQGGKGPILFTHDGTDLSPQHMTVDHSGNLYFTDTVTYSLFKIDAKSGEMTTLAGGGPYTSLSVDGVGAAAAFSYPKGVTSDGNGKLYVCDLGSIRQVEIATRTVTTIAGRTGWWTGEDDGIGPEASFSFSEDLVADGQGNLLVADGSGLVRKVVIATGAVTTLAGGNQNPEDGIGRAAGFTHLKSVTLDNHHLYLLDDRRIRRLDLNTGSVTTVFGTTGRPERVTLGLLSEATLNRPTSIAAIPGGLLITDEDAVLFAEYGCPQASALSMKRALPRP